MAAHLVDADIWINLMELSIGQTKFRITLCVLRRTQESTKIMRKSTKDLTPGQWNCAITPVTFFDKERKLDDNWIFTNTNHSICAAKIVQALTHLFPVVLSVENTKTFLIWSFQSISRQHLSVLEKRWWFETSLAHCELPCPPRNDVGHVVSFENELFYHEFTPTSWALAEQFVVSVKKVEKRIHDFIITKIPISDLLDIILQYLEVG
jgi:hypothetical protein